MPRNLIGISLSLWLCAGCGDSPNDELQRDQCIFGGEDTSTYLHLSMAQSRAILGVTVEDPSLNGPALCTAVLLSSSWLITAGHCQVSEDTRFLIRESRAPCGSTPGEGSQSLSVEVAILHPHEDVLLIELEESLPVDYARPLPIAREETLRPGQRAEIAGVGLTEDGTTGVVQFVTEEVVKVSPDAIDVSGQGETGACTGDSGGPLLARNDDGAVVVEGILSQGESSCTGIDRYLRLSPLLDWITSWTGPLPEPEPSCDGIDEEGVCLERRVARCVDGELALELCGDGQVCGRDDSANRFRCLEI